MINCSKCQTPLPKGAKFCFNCGAKQEKAQTTYQPLEVNYALDFNQAIDKQIADLFFQALQTRVETEHEANRYPDYMEVLYNSGFRDTVQMRSQQLAEQAQALANTELAAEFKISNLLETAYDDLLDYFIIHFCKDLNKVILPEAILKYQYVQLHEIDLFQMVMDYLDFTREDETIYTDFLLMPIDKLRNAGKSFLFPEKNERILFICDQTMFGSVKEGFAMTDKALYWKASLQKSRAIPYTQLATIERQSDWLHINGYFFNVNESLNLKMMKLLKKLKSMYF